MEIQELDTDITVNYFIQIGGRGIYTGSFTFNSSYQWIKKSLTLPNLIIPINVMLF